MLKWLPLVFCGLLFFATAAFPEGAALAQTKMGALFSFIAVPVALAVWVMTGMRQASKE